MSRARSGFKPKSSLFHRETGIALFSQLDSGNKESFRKASSRTQRSLASLRRRRSLISAANDEGDGRTEDANSVSTLGLRRNSSGRAALNLGLLRATRLPLGR